MKNCAHLSLTMKFLLFVVITGLAVPVAFPTNAAGKPGNETPKKVKNAKVERGPELAARLKKLKETDKNVRAALWAFEKAGRQPKLDEATSISGIIESSGSQPAGTNLTRARKPNEGIFR